MDYVFDFLINVVAHRLGVRVPSFLTARQFEGGSGYAWGCAILVGGA